MQSSKPKTSFDLEIERALKKTQGQGIRVKEDDIVICSKCQSEFFVAGIRLAKSKVDLTNVAVGLIHEQPFVFCMVCGTMLSHNANEIKVKADVKVEPPVVPSDAQESTVEDQPKTQDNQ